MANKNPGNSRRFTPAQRALTAERKAKAWQLRMAGASYQQIGAELGLDWTTIRGYINERLDSLNPIDPKETERVRREEIERLNGYLLNLSRGIQAGDTSAINTALSISARKARLKGADAPLKTADTNVKGEDIHDDDRTDEELLAKLERILAFHRRKAPTDSGGSRRDPSTGEGGDLDSEPGASD